VLFRARPHRGRRREALEAEPLLHQRRHPRREQCEQRHLARAEALVQADRKRQHVVGVDAHVEVRLVADDVPPEVTLAIFGRAEIVGGDVGERDEARRAPRERIEIERVEWMEVVR
jgi:hypothetical protein